MANPCIISYKGTEYTYEQWMSTLHDGLLDTLVNEGSVSIRGKEKAVLTVPQASKGKREKPETRDKRLLTRAYEGTTSEGVKEAIERYGLTYEVENWVTADELAMAFIEDVGLLDALNAVRKGSVTGAPAAKIWSEAIDAVGENLAKAKDPSEIAQLEQMEADLLEEFSNQAKKGGQFISKLQDIYKNAQFGYKASTQIARYKDNNGGEIPADIEAKFRQLEKELQQVNEDLAEAEARADRAEQEQAIANIEESIAREKEEKKAAKTIKEKTQAIADRIRQGKTNRPSMFMSSSPAALAWDAALDIAATTVSTTGVLANAVSDGIKAALEYFNNTDWYKSLSKKDQEKADGLLVGFLNESSEAQLKGTVVDGKIKIPHKLIRQKVEEGITDPDELTKSIYDDMIDEFPEITERQVRDAISSYGKVVNPNQEEVEAQIRKIKRIDRIISGLEDIREKKQRPLRTGQQRDALDAEERALLKKLNEAMKELPQDAATNAKQMKNALDAVKTRLRNQIEDIQREIDAGKKAEKSIGVPYDDEANALVAERDALKAISDKIFGDKELSDEQKLARAIKALENAIKTKEDMLKSGDIFPTQASNNVTETPELKKLRDKNAELQEEIDRKRALLKEPAVIIKSSLETAIENKIAATKKAIEEKERKIRDYDLTTYQGVSSVGKDNAELQALKDKSEQLSKDLRKMREDARIKKSAEAIANGNAIRALEKRARDIAERIRNNELELAKKTSLVDKTSPEYKAAKLAAERQLEVLKQMQIAAGIPEKKRLENAKKAAKRQIANLEQKLRDKDYSKRKIEPVLEDTELIQLRAEKLRLQDQFDKEQYQNELNNRSKTTKVLDAVYEAWNLTRALRATAEFSFVVVQGGINLVAHPINSAKAFVNAMSHFASEKRSDDFLRTIQAQEFYSRLKASKLALTEHDAKLSAREELFMSGWVSHIWDILGLPIKLGSKNGYEMWKRFSPPKAFERAAVGYLNTLRVERYIQGEQMLSMQGKTFKDSPQDYKDMADVINTFTGRGSLGFMEGKGAKYLSVMFFSPRMIASTLKQVTPFGLFWLGKKHSKGDPWYKPSVAQKMAVGDYMKYVGLTAGVLAYIAASGDDDDKDDWKVGMDPTDSKFMKVYRGDVVIDPWAGRSQMVVLQARFFYDVITRKGKAGKPVDVPLGQNGYIPTKGDLLIQTFQNKLAPSAGMVNKYLFSHVDKTGVRVDKFGVPIGGPLAMTTDNLYPIYWETIKEVNKDQPGTTAAFLDGMAFFGMGVNVYSKTNPPKKKARRKLQ
tara:strand:+ start:21238 stop:25092 length:3855 start_codon:yes stop_codon:yes gene_type:complete